ncbi:MAG: hypothetical protein WHT08_16790 [Bryobacteraceae bacterium]|jgi:hypothetical protein
MGKKFRGTLAMTARVLAVSVTLPAVTRLMTHLGSYQERPMPGEAMVPAQLAMLISMAAVYFILACGWRHPLFLLSAPLSAAQILAATVVPQPWILAASAGSLTLSAGLAWLSPPGRRAWLALLPSLALAFCAFLILAIASPYAVQCGREAAWASDLKAAGAILGAGVLFCLSFQYGVTRMRSAPAG